MNERFPFDLIVYDFDGVLTDNRVSVSESGQETVMCHRGDGWWIQKISELGIKQIICSTEKNPVVSVRAKKIGIEAFQAVSNKYEMVREYAERGRFDLKRVAYIGNDMNDYECLQMVGYPFAPKDAHPRVLTIAQILPQNGGYGVVRELYELIHSHEASQRLSEKLVKIKLLVTDVDGVLTDGRIYLTEAGEVKAFWGKDAPRTAIAVRAGIKVCFFTARKGPAVVRRAAELNADIVFKPDLKASGASFVEGMQSRFGVKPEEILYVGDDWSDLHAMKQVGISATPADGSKENREVALITTKAKGGEGVLAELIEMLMRAQGTWERYSKEYLSELIY